MKNIVLIGFMGTGKTSTGRSLAQRLGFCFIDLDQKIEEAAGMTIPEMSQSGSVPSSRSARVSRASARP